MQSHHTVEHTTTSEVQYGIGELLDGVVFYIDSVMSFVLKCEDAHVGARRSSLWRFRMGKVVSQKARIL